MKKKFSKIPKLNEIQTLESLDFSQIKEYLEKNREEKRNKPLEIKKKEAEAR